MLLIFIKNQNEKVMKVFMINNLTMFELEQDYHLTTSQNPLKH
jgi:hypothetical protein